MMAESIDSLIARLRSFRSRAQAVEELIGLGGAAVPALIGALRSRHQGLRSAVMICLGQIGDMRACPELLRMLDNDATRGDASQALQRITGERLGADVKAWAQWMRANGIDVPDECAPSEARASIATLVSNALKGADVRVETKKAGPKVTVRLPTGRKQTVRVLERLKDSGGRRLVAVYTACGDAAPEKYEWALRTNVRLTQGRLAIHDVEGKPTFVLVNTHLRETLQPEELRISIMKVAAVGDRIEEMLTGEDVR